MIQVVIASMEKAQEILGSPGHEGVTHLVSIGDPPREGYDQPTRMNRYEQFKRPKIRLEFDDISFLQPTSMTAAIAAGYTVASEDDVKTLINFFQSILDKNESAKVLIHCAAGISRSAASAVIFFAMQLGPGREKDAFVCARMIKPGIHPNKHVLRLADRLLDRKGALVGMAYEFWPERDYPVVV